MNANSIASVLEAKKGRIFTVTVNHPANLRAAYKGENITKRSVYQGQNCDYASRGPVKQAIAAGNMVAPALPQHIQEPFYISGVKFWRGKNGQVYFPMPVTGNKPKVQWLYDGKEVTLASIQHMLLANEYAERPEKSEPSADGKVSVPFNAIKVENIESITCG